MKLIYTRQFEKDVKKAIKRGKDMEKLKVVINKLVSNEDTIIFERIGTHSDLFR